MEERLSTTTIRFVMRVVDELEHSDEGIPRAAEVFIPEQMKEAPYDVLQEMFWATFEKARDEWMTREHKRSGPPSESVR